MKKKLNCAGILVGILCLIFAFCSFVMGNTHLTKYETYGGDAYTGIQNAAADTANNVNDMADTISVIGGYIFLIAGLVIIIHFAKELCKESEAPKYSKEPTLYSYSGDPHSSSVNASTSSQPWVCASCGTPNPAKSIKCVCGAYNSSPAPGSVWFCNSCGELNPVSKVNCSKCGKSK